MAKATQAEKDARASKDAGLKANDSAAKYLELTPEETAAGRQRPVRFKYRHVNCTKLGQGFVNGGNVEDGWPERFETLADNPGHRKRFWPCYFEGRMFPLSEFVWVTDDGKDTPLVLGT